jgi:TonB family protein
MKLFFSLLLCLSGVVGQQSQPLTPHDLLVRAKRIGLTDKTVVQVEPLLQQCAMLWPGVDPRSAEYGETLRLLGMVKQWEAQGDINLIRTTVEPLYKRALAIYSRALVPPEPLEMALTLELEAAALNGIGQVQDATLLSDRALTIRKEHVREMQAGEPAVGAAYKPGEGITAPVAMKRQEPAYNDVASFLKIEGTAVLRVIVDAQGLPRDIALVQSIGYGLDENAVTAVRAWRFKPGTSGGDAVPVILNVDVDFRMR